MNHINGWALTLSTKTGAGKTAVWTTLQVKICKKQLVWGSRHNLCKQNHCVQLAVGMLTSLILFTKILGAI